MRLLEQHELRQRASRYFPPGRVKPFIILLMHAIIALKRLAKRLKQNVIMAHSESRKKVASYLLTQIRKVDKIRHMAQYGGPVITECDIKAPVREVLEFRNRKTGLVYEDEEDAMEASKRAAKVQRLPKFRPKAVKFHKHFHRLVNEQVNRFTNQVARGGEATEVRLAKKLTKAYDSSTKKLKTGLAMVDPGPQRRGGHDLRPSTAPASIVNTSTHPTLQVTLAPESPHGDDDGPGRAEESHTPGNLAMPGLEDDIDERQVEYPKGAGIYYGSSVSLQARHGGFLSFKNQQVSTAAFRVCNTSKYIVIKASDMTSRGAVCFGDAVWLCIGDPSANSNYCFLVGAAFASKVVPGEARQLTPQLINHGVDNRYKSSQYGRWIILKKSHPVESKGTPVGHLDEILLEQEWSFLASNSTGLASCHKLEADIDNVMNQTQEVDLLRPANECGWRIGIAGYTTGTMASAAENRRARLIDKATQQVKHSKSFRVEFMMSGIMSSLESRLDPRLSNEALKEGWAGLERSGADPLQNYSKQGWTGEVGPLHAKQSAFLSQKHLVHKFAEMAANGFSHQPSLDFIKSLYGKHSLIYKKKKEVLSLRAAAIGIVKPPTRIVEVADQTALEEYEDDYWRANQALQVPAEVWAVLHNSMRSFYDADLVKKIDAVVAIQRAVRTWLQTRFHFGRKFAAIDRQAAIKWHHYFLQRRRRLVFADDPEDSSGAPSKSRTKSTLLNAASTMSSAATTSGDAAALPERQQSYATIDEEKRALARKLPGESRKAQSMYGKVENTLAAQAAVSGLQAQGLLLLPAGSGAGEEGDGGAVKSALDHGALAGVGVPVVSTIKNKRGSMPHINMHSPSSPTKAASAPLLLLASPVVARSGQTAAFTTQPATPTPITPAPLSPEQERAATKARERASAKQQLATKLAKNDTRDFGLPADVFEGLISSKASASSGVKFLRAISSSSDLYADIRSKKRRDRKVAEAGAGRPQTAYS